MSELGPNFIVRPYRGVSVQDVPTLDPAGLREHVLARRVYRRTEFIVGVHGDRRAVVRVQREPGDDVLVGVRDARVVAGPDDVAFVEDERVDTGIATQLARAAAASGRRARVFVVQGRFQHVNLIVEPAPLRVRVLEVVPPEPPKLLEMAQAMVDVDGDLPPLELVLDPIDLREPIAAGPTRHWLLPCRSGGLDPELPIEFLDSGPPADPDWTLVGCERSRQIFVALYGAEPRERVDFCPRLRGDDDGPLLRKCCLRERGIACDGDVAEVPWGASLDEVRAALRRLCGLPAAAPLEVA